MIINEATTINKYFLKPTRIRDDVVTILLAIEFLRYKGASNNVRSSGKGYNLAHK